MSRLWSPLLSIASLSLVLGLAWYTEQNPRVLVYAVFFESIFRMLTVEGLIRIHEGRMLGLLEPHLSRLSSPPGPKQISLAWKDGNSGEDVGLSAYIFILVVISGSFAFPMLHLDRHRELDITFPVFASEFGWGFLLAIIYWVEDLVGRQIKVSFSKSRGQNFGYNAFGFTAMVFAILTAGTVLAFYPMSAGDPSPWIFCTPVLMFRHLLNFRTPGAGLPAAT